MSLFTFVFGIVLKWILFSIFRRTTEMLLHLMWSIFIKKNHCDFSVVYAVVHVWTHLRHSNEYLIGTHNIILRDAHCRHYEANRQVTAWPWEPATSDQCTGGSHDVRISYLIPNDEFDVFTTLSVFVYFHNVVCIFILKLFNQHIETNWLAQLGMSVLCEYAITAYLAHCRIFHIF